MKAKIAMEVMTGKISCLAAAKTYQTAPGNIHHWIRNYHKFANKPFPQDMPSTAKSPLKSAPTAPNGRLSMSPRPSKSSRKPCALLNSRSLLWRPLSIPPKRNSIFLSEKNSTPNSR
jgi:hypothetical protein